MSQRSIAIAILQKAREALSERLTERIVDAQQEIEADAAGSTYLSEIETIYEQLGSRLAHVNAMLSNLPPTVHPSPEDVTASEIIYADLASSYTTPLDMEAATPLTLLALPAPASFEKRAEIGSPANEFAQLAARIEVGDLAGAGRLISEVFDIKPSQASRWVTILARRIGERPDLVDRLTEVGSLLEISREQPLAELLAECFELQIAEALAVACAIKLRLGQRDRTW